MLKSVVGETIRMVPQHQHAQVSGYLAAHWGGANGFARPGEGAAADAAHCREEVVLGIAEHDNGWWEWEAMPKINGRDGLPIGLGEVAEPSPANEFDEWRAGGFDRWRQGIERLMPGHPYGALLTSLHAYWLYAVAFDDLMEPEDEALRHFIFGAPETAANLAKDRETVRRFLDEQAVRQEELKTETLRDPRMTGATDPGPLRANLRLLQLLDSLSLFLALNDQTSYELPNVPRADWQDRVTLSWHWAEAEEIVLDPYPFDLDPLPVTIPVRMAAAARLHTPVDHRTVLASLHGLPFDVLRFEFRSNTSTHRPIKNQTWRKAPCL